MIFFSLLVGALFLSFKDDTIMSSSSTDPNSKSLSGKTDIKDVIIVGGGVSGLAALNELIKNGVTNVLLLEAQEYLGGRIKTTEIGSVTLDEGAQWIEGGEKNSLYPVARKIKEILPPLPDSAFETKIKRSDGSFNPYDLKVLERVYDFYEDSLFNGKLVDFYKKGYGDYLIARLKKDGVTSSLTPEMKQAWLHYFEQFVNYDEGTGDWNDISARDADQFVDYEGDDYQWKSGATALIKHLEKPIPKSAIELNSPVTKIHWDQLHSDKLVELTVQDGRKFYASRVIVTMSVAVLKTTHEELFQPSLPNRLKNALKYIDLGNANKVFIHWDDPWWGDKYLDLHIIWTKTDLPTEMKWMEGIAYMFSTDQSRGTLMTFVTGNYSLQMQQLTEEQVKGHLIYLLSLLFEGTSIPEPGFVKRTQWGMNRWVLGSYSSYVTIEGALNGIHSRAVYAEPLRNSKNKQVVFWAGEHTHISRYGTADGAYQSGLKAARKIISSS